MKIVLKADVKKLGRKGDIVNVSTGYARNLLIPQGMAVLVDDVITKQILAEKAREDEKVASKKKIAELRAKELEGQEIEIKVKTGVKGELFAGVGEKEIEAKLGFGVKKINIDNPIKAVGEYEVEVEVEAGVKAKIKVKVVAE